MSIKALLPFLEENKEKTKLHCATTSTDKSSPLVVFAQGGFKEWQEEQTKKNFERDYIISLIYYKKNEWLFAGIYRSINVVQNEKGIFNYTTELLDEGRELIGRLIVLFEKEFRSSYLLLENYLDALNIAEILRKPYTVGPFPGFENLFVSYNDLKGIITRNEESWKSVLSNVKGVYLISDIATGKLYVGSAYGDQAFWTRWTNYIETGHGGNVLLKEILGNNSIEYAENFCFSILEIMKMGTDDEHIIKREAYWKDILLSRSFGYNKN